MCLAILNYCSITFILHLIVGLALIMFELLRVQITGVQISEDLLHLNFSALCNTYSYVIAIIHYAAIVSLQCGHYAVLTTSSLDICDGCYGTVVASSLDTTVTKSTAVQVCCHWLLIM